MTRISTAQVFQNGIQQILERQSQLQSTENQVASGKRVINASDDPIAAGQILRLNTELTKIDQYSENANIASTELSLEENAITNVQNDLQRFRELVLQSNNASQSFTERTSIRVELEQITQQIISTANSRSATGSYLFSGNQASTKPFQINGGNTTYQGDSGQRSVRIGNNSEVSLGDPGDKAFMSIPTGDGVISFSADSGNTGNAYIDSTSASGSYIPDTYEINFSQLTADDPITYEVVNSLGTSVATGTYSDGANISFAGASIEIDGVPANNDRFVIQSSTPQDLFSSLTNITNALASLGDESSERARLTTELAFGIENIDQALDHLSGVRTDIGSRLGRIDTQLNLNSNFELRVQESLSNLEDLDLTEAISKLNLEVTTLEAAQQAYIRVQGLSLFNYL